MKELALSAPSQRRLIAVAAIALNSFRTYATRLPSYIYLAEIGIVFRKEGSAVRRESSSH
jgi:hypothetical protein